MRFPTKRKLFAVFVTLFPIGILLLFYNIVLSLIVLAVSAIGIEIMVNEQEGMIKNWRQLVRTLLFPYYKKVDTTEKKIEGRKVSTRRILWLFVSISICGVGLLFMYTIPLIGVLLFFVFIINLVVMLFITYGEERPKDA